MNDIYDITREQMMEMSVEERKQTFVRDGEIIPALEVLWITKVLECHSPEEYEDYCEARAIDWGVCPQSVEDNDLANMLDYVFKGHEF